MPGGSSTDGKLTFYQRTAAALGGATVSAIVVNPLEVVKTRLQMTQTNGHNQSTFGMSRKILREEGIRALWRGTSVQIVNSLPTVGVYLMTYDKTLETLRRQQHSVVPASFMPLVSGITARAVAVCLSSPIENIKTMMYASTSKTANPLDIVRSEIRRGGIKALFRGFLPYFWRDVPFSAIYWMTLEHSRAAVLQALMKRKNMASSEFVTQREKWKANQDSSTNLTISSTEILGINVVSGLSAGMIAAFVTTPVDVIYVNRVIDRADVGNNNGQLARAKSLSSTDVVREIVRKEGVTGLFRGVVPRVGKVAPSCAIVIATYEIFKRAIYISTTETA